MTVRLAKTQINLGIHPIWSESLLFAQWVAKDPNFLHADRDYHTGWMPRLIWVFAGRTCHFVGFVMRRLKFSPEWAQAELHLSLVPRKLVLFRGLRPGKTQTCLLIVTSYILDVSDLARIGIILPRELTTRRRSVCPDAQADLCLCCLHMMYNRFPLKWLFSHDFFLKVSLNSTIHLQQGLFLRIPNIAL